MPQQSHWTRVIPAAAFLLVAVLLVGALAVAAGPKAASKSDPAARIAFTAQGSGAHAYRISNPAGIGVTHFRVEQVRGYDYQPWHIELIQPDGQVHHRIGVLQDGDSAHFGLGDGVVYAGGPDSTLQTPNALGAGPWINDWEEQLPGKTGLLVIAWVNQVDPINFSLEFGKGTVIGQPVEAPLRAYEAKDFQGGVRAGVPALLRTHLGDSVELQPVAGQLWGYVFYMRSTAPGRGALTVDRAGDGLHRELSLDGSSISCICFEWGRWIFTSDSDVRVGLDYVGDGARTAVYVVAADFPAGTFPQNIWQESVY